MLDDALIDSCMLLLPNVKAVVVARPDGSSPVSLTARREETTAEQREMSGVQAGVQMLTWFVPADQTGFVRPRNQWTITHTEDGTTWVVQHEDFTHQSRGSACTCTLSKG